MAHLKTLTWRASVETDYSDKNRDQYSQDLNRVPLEYTKNYALPMR
jgi:hypothetical protein